jgi:nitrile hydratase accessory protein
MTGSDHLVFEEPWQAKAFALTVALHERGLYSWQEWSQTLGAKIAAGEAHGDASEYYRNWLTALEGLLAEKGVTTEAERTDWLQAWRRAAARTPHGAPIEVHPEDF